MSALSPGAQDDLPDGAALDFEAYVRASGVRLKRIAFLLTGDPATAEDLLQTAYAKVLPRWDRVAADGDPDAYLRRVMVNTRTSWWRLRRGREYSTGEVPEHLARAGRSLDPADEQVDLSALLAALRVLPRGQQVAVVLRHYCDLSEAETAATMGISVGSVKSQASKGRAALRAALGSSTGAGRA
jgi:RNA polymerase sigma-70 factor (sigma-E family)